MSATPGAGRRRLSTVLRCVHTLRYLRPGQISGRLLFRARRPRPDMRAPPGLRTPQSGYSRPVAGAPQLLSPQRLRILNIELACATAADWQPAGLEPAVGLPPALLRRPQCARRRGPGRLARGACSSAGSRRKPSRSRTGLGAVSGVAADRELGEVGAARPGAAAGVPARAWRCRHAGSRGGSNTTCSATTCWPTQGAGARRAVLRRSGGRGLVPRRACDILARQLPRAGAGRRRPLRAQPHVPRARARGPARPRQSAADLRPADPASQWPPPRRTCDLARGDDAPGRRASPSSTTPPSASRRRPAELEAYAAASGLGAVAVPAEPLVVLAAERLRAGRAVQRIALCDCAPVGPDYLPAHAHADTLSFELSLCGRRLLVNSGTSQYGTDGERQRQRGTAAHNSVLSWTTRTRARCGPGFASRGARARTLRWRGRGAPAGCRSSPATTATAGCRGATSTGAAGGWRAHRCRSRISSAARSAAPRRSLHLHPQVRRAKQWEQPRSLLTVRGRRARACSSRGGARRGGAAAGDWHPRFGVRRWRINVWWRTSPADADARISAWRGRHEAARAQLLLHARI